MICEECKAQEKTSQLRQVPPTDPTKVPAASATDSFFDEKGTWHVHIPDRTIYWKCSNGHTFTSTASIPCGPCVHAKQQAKPKPAPAPQPGQVPATQKAGTPVKK